MGGIKTGKQLTAHDKNINVPCAELVLHCLFVGICVTVAVHHFIPVGNDLIVGTLVYIVYTFPQSGGEITTAQFKSPNCSKHSRYRIASRL